VIWKFLEEMGWEVGERMRGELGRMPMVTIAFLQARLAWLTYFYRKHNRN
jgi:hypothetical protein